MKYGDTVAVMLKDGFTFSGHITDVRGCEVTINFTVGNDKQTLCECEARRQDFEPAGCLIVHRDYVIVR